MYCKTNGDNPVMNFHLDYKLQKNTLYSLVMKPLEIVNMNLPIKKKIIVKTLSNKLFFMILSTKIVAKNCNVLG